jgi:hypothetical protein
MTYEEALEFARGMFGPDGEVDIDEHDRYAIGILEDDLFVSLGEGYSWEQAVDHSMQRVEHAAMENIGPWEPHECPF